MKFYKMRDVKSPEQDGYGLNLFVPNDFPGEHYLATRQSLELHTGIMLDVPDMVMLLPYSGGNKTGLHVTINDSYLDDKEITLLITNLSWDLQTVRPGDKIARIFLLPITPVESIIEVDSVEKLYMEAAL